MTPSPSPQPALTELFFSFLKIGAFTLGGGYAMIPLVREEVVEKKCWMHDEEFLNMLALAQSAPGVMAVNTAFFIGYKLRGYAGVFAAVLGSILPSFTIILLIAAVFTRFREMPAVEAVFKGIRPAVVALIAAPLWKMARSAGLMQTQGTRRDIAVSWLLMLIPVAAALLIWLAGLSPVIIIAFTIVAALVVTICQQRRTHR